MRPSPSRITGACAGAFTAEFAFVVILFLMIVGAAFELARVLYMFNTLQMVTQRAAALAANADFSNSADMNKVRQRAVFRDSPGLLAAGAPVTDAYVRIDYLSLSGAGATMAALPSTSLPACAANNRVTCMRDPYNASCVRLVRARICDPADTAQCRSVPYQVLFPFLGMPINLPKATAIVNAETLGAPPGHAPCP
jgi:Flp pilus assembly protein TadG